MGVNMQNVTRFGMYTFVIINSFIGNNVACCIKLTFGYLILLIQLEALFDLFLKQKIMHEA